MDKMKLVSNILNDYFLEFQKSAFLNNKKALQCDLPYSLASTCSLC